MKRDEFKGATKRTLADRVNFVCSNPNCRANTSFPIQGTFDKSASLGVAAHITAAAPGGPRYDSNLAPEQRSSIRNGIWLCQQCARLIDSDEVRFSVELLYEWKRFSELEAIRTAGKPKSHFTETGTLTVRENQKRIVVSLAYDCCNEAGLFIPVRRFKETISRSYLRCGLFDIADNLDPWEEMPLVSFHKLDFFPRVEAYKNSPFLPRSIASQLQKVFEFKKHLLDKEFDREPDFYCLGGLPRLQEYPEIDWNLVFSYSSFGGFKKKVKKLRSKIRWWLRLHGIFGLNLEWTRGKWWLFTENESLPMSDPIWLKDILGEE